jgi:hypothetical protein
VSCRDPSDPAAHADPLQASLPDRCERYAPSQARLSGVRGHRQSSQALLTRTIWSILCSLAHCDENSSISFALSGWRGLRIRLALERAPDKSADYEKDDEDDRQCESGVVAACPAGRTHVTQDVLQKNAAPRRKPRNRRGSTDGKSTSASCAQRQIKMHVPYLFDLSSVRWRGQKVRRAFSRGTLYTHCSVLEVCFCKHLDNENPATGGVFFRASTLAPIWRATSRRRRHSGIRAHTMACADRARGIAWRTGVRTIGRREAFARSVVAGRAAVHRTAGGRRACGLSA